MILSRQRRKENRCKVAGGGKKRIIYNSSNEYILLVRVNAYMGLLCEKKKWEERGWTRGGQGLVRMGCRISMVVPGRACVIPKAFVSP